MFISKYRKKEGGFPMDGEQTGQEKARGGRLKLVVPGLIFMAPGTAAYNFAAVKLTPQIASAPISPEQPV